MNRAERARLLSLEQGAIRKERARLSVALAYPNSYYVAMSNLGFQAVYFELNRRDDTCCERVFCVPAAGPAAGRAPVSLETGRGLGEFDVVAFSMPYEPDAANLLRMLSAGGIPVRGADRDGTHPLVVAGGLAASANPEPLAAFVDAFVIGEGEEAVHELADTVIRGAGTRAGMLERLAEVPGIYVPEAGAGMGTVSRRWIRDIDTVETVSRILTPETEFGNVFLVELSRGCPWRCGFCLARTGYRPVRWRSARSVLGSLERSGGKGDRVGLVGLDVGAYPHLEDVVEYLQERGRRMTVASLRTESLSESLLGAMARGGQTTLTLAPEAGSRRLRRVVGKGAGGEELSRWAASAREAGIPNVKLYFLIGLPSETDEDCMDIVGVVRSVRDSLLESSRKSGRMGRVTVSIGPFVPKPHTPFQWAAMAGRRVLAGRLRMLERAFAVMDNVTMISESIKWAHWQGLLARGDRRMGLALEAFALGGATPAAALSGAGLDEERELHRERDTGEALPWDHLDWGTGKQDLADEYRRALARV